MKVPSLVGKVSSPLTVSIDYKQGVISTKRAYRIDSHRGVGAKAGSWDELGLALTWRWGTFTRHLACTLEPHKGVRDTEDALYHSSVWVAQ